MNYRVNVIEKLCYPNILVEADSEEEAEEKAISIVKDGMFWHDSATWEAEAKSF